MNLDILLFIFYFDLLPSLSINLCQDNYLDAILEGVSKRACNKEIDESELGSLQSIFSKLLAHFNNLEDIFALVCLLSNSFMLWSYPEFTKDLEMSDLFICF